MFTIREVDRLSDQLLDCNKEGKLRLDEIFKPLHKISTSIIREESKAYGPSRKSWLRVYAIRITEDFYAISGGSIKLTKTMLEMDDYHEQLQKLKVVAAYLKRNGIDCPEDYRYFDIE